MFDTILVATDGSESVSRAVGLAIDLAARFDASVHALYVVEAEEVESSPVAVREDLRDALGERGQRALERISDAAGAREETLDVVTDVREGDPADEISVHAESIDADLVVTGTRGRHGENRFLIGSVAEHVVRNCPVPVLTVRRLTNEDPRQVTV
ncbi:MAG: universal stress protein [Halorubrum sp.]